MCSSDLAVVAALLCQSKRLICGDWIWDGLHELAPQGCDFGLLFRYLGCVVGIGFGAVFAAFRSGHHDNLFPFLVVHIF